MKRLLISTAVLLAMSSFAVGCGKKAEPAKAAASASAAASAATPSPTPGLSTPEEIALEVIKLMDKADGAAAVKFMYVPEKSKTTFAAEAAKRITDNQAKGMIAAMGEPLVTKVVYFEQIKGDQPIPVKLEEVKVGTLCQATISIKLTKDIGDKKAGTVEEITPTILIKTEEGWKFMDPMDKETMALLEARVKK
jgi:hypothetical protein